MASSLLDRVLDQHWAVVEPLSTRADWVSYHYYVGLLKISEDKVSYFSKPSLNLFFSCVFFAPFPRCGDHLGQLLTSCSCCHSVYKVPFGRRAVLSIRYIFPFKSRCPSIGELFCRHSEPICWKHETVNQSIGTGMFYLPRRLHGKANAPHWEKTPEPSLPIRASGQKKRSLPIAAVGLLVSRVFGVSSFHIIH